ncbi:exodeoxyribonuclease VII small subunit [Deinococcus budaensis]|uniref:Exodeoxyribonuclease VII small subunit n=1 Tax=Deinococcus budaensis TaxID=1665626 RepID=A0A7W8GI76_9DEIO|nr:exodeoxyribonuclease VII small subunit [Deinococcus budaensis]MBB5236085.1 exodeoxyribonuclease VII small subunit [Deinococcus budaensis]
MPDASPPLSYREAYARLARIAAELETGEADLDRVLPLLEEARAAYAACRERIEAVREVLAGEWTEGELAADDQEGRAPDPDSPDPDGPDTDSPDADDEPY